MLPETPKGNIATYYEGLKTSERKPGLKSPFLATIFGENGEKKRRSLNVVNYKSKDTTDIEMNDRLLRHIGVTGDHLAIITLPNDDKNRIEANLDTAFINIKLPFPKTVDIIARLESMGGSAPSVGNAPSYMDKINSIVNGNEGTKRKRDNDDEGEQDE